MKICEGDFLVHPSKRYIAGGHSIDVTLSKKSHHTYPDIVPKDSQTVEIWGVVVAAVKQFKS